MKFIKDYLEVGRGKDLLFFHGISASPRFYWDTINNMSKDFRTLAPYVTEFNDLDRLGEESYDLFKEKNMKKAIIVGHSAGGILAYDFALRHPDDVSALVLIDSAGAGVRGSILYLFLMCLKPGFNILLNNKKSFLRIAKSFLNGFMKPIKLSRSAKFVSNYVIEKKEFKFPVLILYGADDTLTPVSHGKKLNALLPGSKLEVVSGDHLWLEENPGLLLSKLKRFL